MIMSQSESNTLTRLYDDLLEAGACCMLDDLKRYTAKPQAVSDFFDAVERMFKEHLAYKAARHNPPRRRSRRR